MRFLAAFLVGCFTVAAAIRINCGGKALSGYEADSRQYHGKTNGYVGAYPRNRITNTVYETHAYSVHSNRLVYSFSMPAMAGKNVDVIARFMEIWGGAAEKGKRVFRVYFNDKMVKDSVDVYSEVGLNKPYDVKGTLRVPANGVIRISVQAIVENAMISGIDIEESGSVSNANESAMKPAMENPTGNNRKDEQPVADGTPQLKGSGAWRTVQLAGGPEPIRRHEACAVMANGKVYLIGGRGRKGTSVFDTKTRRWENRGLPPLEMNHMQCVAWKDRYIYVAGAWTGPFPRETALKDTYVYDTIEDSWSTEPGLPVSRRRGGGALVIYDNKIYLGMGNQGGHGRHATAVGYLDVYDPNNKKAGWKALDSAPDARDHVGGGVVGGHYFCIGGGRDGGVANFWGTPVTRVNCYNFKTRKWEGRARMPDGRAGASTGVTCQGLLMIAGGEGREAGTFKGGRAYDRVDLYDVTRDEFRKPVFLKRARHGSGLAVADCKCGNIYLPSGSGGLGGGPDLASTEVWSPDGVARDC